MKQAAVAADIPEVRDWDGRLPLLAALSIEPPATRWVTPDAQLRAAYERLSERLDAMEAGRNPAYRVILMQMEALADELGLQHWERWGY